MVGNGCDQLERELFCLGAFVRFDKFGSGVVCAFCSNSAGIKYSNFIYSFHFQLHPQNPCPGTQFLLYRYLPLLSP